MSRVFIIPDVHLKPWMFEEASKRIAEGQYDHIVMLGDLVDDWNQEKNLELYSSTFDAAEEFVKEHPNTLFCYGNHDLSYPWKALESGYSSYASWLVIDRIKRLVECFPEKNAAYIHRIDNTLFSHGGLVDSFVREQFGHEPEMELDDMLAFINQMGKTKMWVKNSPIWARPQYEPIWLYPSDMFQVVGHTPVERARLEGNLLTLDTFSTCRNGHKIGDEKFVWVDTVDNTFSAIE